MPQLQPYSEFVEGVGWVQRDPATGASGANVNQLIDPPTSASEMMDAMGSGKIPTKDIGSIQKQFTMPEGFSWYGTGQEQPGQQGPSPFDLTQPGAFESFYQNVLPLLSQPGFGQQQWGQSQDIFNQPMYGAEQTKGYMDRMAGPREGAGAVTSAMGGLEGPGAAGNYWNQVQGALGGPMGGEQFMGGQLPGVTQAGIGQQYAAQAVPGMMGQTGGQNLAAQQLQRLQGQMPDLQGGPGLDPYYENAKRRAQEDIRAQTAALGAYGSAAGQDMGAEAMTNLAAEQANREADYRMRQLQEQRQWEGLAGQMAGQASGEQRGWADMLGGLTRGAEGLDISRQGLGANIANMMQGLELGRLGLGGELAGQAGAQDIARNTALGQLGLGQGQLDLGSLIGATNAARGIDQTYLNQGTAGMNAALGLDNYGLNKLFGFGNMAQGAQQAREGRIGGGFDRTQNMGDRLFGGAMGTYGGMQGTEQDLMETINNFLLGETGTGYSLDERQQAKYMEAIKTIMGIVGGGI